MEIREEEETGFFRMILSYDSWAQEHIIVSALGTGTLWYWHDDISNFTLPANVDLYFPEELPLEDMSQMAGCASRGSSLDFVGVRICVKLH